MALSDQDLSELYRWLLNELERAHAIDLLRDIDAVVRTGVAREELGERKAPVTVRVPLTPRERLVAVLELVLAAASIPLMLKDSAAAASLDTTEFKWVPDYFEAEMGTNPPEAPIAFKLTSWGSLDELRSSAHSLLASLEEIGRGDGA